MFTVNGVGNEKKDKASELAPESGRMEDSSSADDDSDKEVHFAFCFFFLDKMLKFCVTFMLQ